MSEHLTFLVCPWHPEYRLPCPVCLLRSEDGHATKEARALEYARRLPSQTPGVVIRKRESD